MYVWSKQNLPWTGRWKSTWYHVGHLGTKTTPHLSLCKSDRPEENLDIKIITQQTLRWADNTKRNFAFPLWCRCMLLQSTNKHFLFPLQVGRWLQQTPAVMQMCVSTCRVVWDVTEDTISLFYKQIHSLPYRSFKQTAVSHAPGKCCRMPRGCTHS